MLYPALSTAASCSEICRERERERDEVGWQIKEEKIMSWADSIKESDGVGVRRREKMTE